MLALVELERLVAAGNEQAAIAFFQKEFHIERTGSFSFDVSARTATPPQESASEEIWMNEGTPGLRGMLFRAVAALDNQRRNRRAGLHENPVQDGVVITHGDSWFSYPFVEPMDVSENLLNLIPVYSMACPGDDVSDISQGEKLDELIWAMGYTGSAHVALSVGGNELIGAEFPEILQCPSGASVATDFLHLDRLEDKITHLISGIERILTHSIAANQNVRVYAHSYDYPFPDATKGSFLETELINTGIPERMHYDICSEIIDQLDAALVAFAHKHPRNFTRVDLRGVSQKRPENWADEVHLTSSAAARAAKRLYHAIRQHSKIDPVVDPTGTV